MPTVIELSTLISLGSVVITIAGVAVGYGVLRNKVNNNVQEIKNLRTIVHEQNKDLAEFKNEVAQDYVSLTNLSSFEARMSGLEERMVGELSSIRETLTTFLTSLAVGSHGKK